MLATTIELSLIWAIVAFIGWLFFIILLVFMLFILIKTPAWTFLLANLTGKPILRAITPTASSRFYRAKRIEAGCADLPDGPFKLMPGSYVRDTKSNVPIFDAFTENATTVTKEYAAIIETLREKGFIINNFEQYKQLVEIASNKADAEGYIKSIEKDEDKARAQKLVKLLQDPAFRVDIKAFRSYKMHELSNMFPYNLSPTFIKEKAVAYNQRIVSKINQKKDYMLMAMVFLIFVIGAALAYKFMAGGSCNCVCQAAKAGASNVVNALSGNVTM